MSNIFCAETQTAHLLLPPSWSTPFKTLHRHWAPHSAGAAPRQLLVTPVNFTLGQQSFACPIPWAVIHLSSVRGKGDASKRINIHVFKRRACKHMACSPMMIFSWSLGEKTQEVFCLFSVWFVEASADQEVRALSSTAHRDLQNCPKKKTP